MKAGKTDFIIMAHLPICHLCSLFSLQMFKKKGALLHCGTNKSIVSCYSITRELVEGISKGIGNQRGSSTAVTEKY